LVSTHTYHDICRQIRLLTRELRRVVVAIDGGSAGGKSTLAARLAREFGGQVIPMDDFFLPAARRAPRDSSPPGGHMDYERFCAEVVTPLRRGEPPAWGVFDCADQAVTHTKTLPPAPLYLVEGAYATHPDIPDIYDLRIFVRVDGQTQRRRLTEREGSGARRFFEEWIPRENAYFAAYMTEQLADMVYVGSAQDTETEDES